jgi:hypothetical protein
MFIIGCMFIGIGMFIIGFMPIIGFIPIIGIFPMVWFMGVAFIMWGASYVRNENPRKVPSSTSGAFFRCDGRASRPSDEPSVSTDTAHGAADGLGSYDTSDARM